MGLELHVGAGRHDFFCRRNGGVHEYCASSHRKRQSAIALRQRVGDVFDAVVTGATSRATWLRILEPEAEGRLVRGRRGLRVGDALRVVLLSVDSVRGYIDFARA